MSMTTTYFTHFYDVLRDNGISQTELPVDLQQLIEMYESTKDSWNRADTVAKENYIEAIVQSDALISALIVKQYNPTQQNVPSKTINDARLKELKIKALKLKYNISQLKP